MDNLLPERLKLARMNMGITMAEASRRVNLSKIGYCRYEYGDRSPSIQTIEILAQGLNTSVDFLTGKTEDMAPDFVLIRRESDKELFDLVNSYRKLDDEAAKRVMSYVKELSKL